MIVRNLLLDIPSDLPEESTDALATARGLRIERIVSRGHRSPDDFWYDQPETEWVLVLSGRARLQVENDDSLRELSAGDFLEIPPHRRHRVVWTDPDQNTVWLAVFHSDDPARQTPSDLP